MARIAANPEAYFWQRVEPMMDDSGCWEWTGVIDAYGRGIAAVAKLRMRAYRFAYTLFVAPIPHGFTIDHLCFNRRCVNPQHLEAVTQRENVQRYNLAKRNMRYMDGQMVVCPRGHETTEDNVLLLKRGGKYDGDAQLRCCKTCHRIRAAKYRKNARKRIDTPASEGKTP